MKTNILVQYSGGGYDGCIWEWNYFYIDENGDFHNIAASGCDGVETLEAAKELMERDETHTYIYDMSKDEDIVAFGNESNPYHIINIFRWFDDYNSEHVNFFVECSECKGETHCWDETIEQGNRIICHECYLLGECPCCESYVGETEMVGVDNRDEHYGFDYICASCKECHDEQRETDNLEDLRWLAFCTGTPDIFSEELRRIWVT